MRIERDNVLIRDLNGERRLHKRREVTCDMPPSWEVAIGLISPHCMLH